MQGIVVCRSRRRGIDSGSQVIIGQVYSIFESSIHFLELAFDLANKSSHRNESI